MYRTYTYALKCPLTYKIMYIGKTVNPNQRYVQHCIGKKSHNHDKSLLYDWVRRLGIYGYKPLMKILCEYDNERDLIRENKNNGILNKHYTPKDMVLEDMPILPQHYAKLMREIRQNSINNKKLLSCTKTQDK